MQKISSFGQKEKQTKFRHIMDMLRHLQFIQLLLLFLLDNGIMMTLKHQILTKILSLTFKCCCFSKSLLVK